MSHQLGRKRIDIQHGIATRERGVSAASGAHEREKQMKKFQTALLAGLVIAGMAFAQDKPGDKNSQKSGQQATQPAQTGAAPAPGTKQARSPEEFKAYNAANALSDPAAVEKAALDFSEKYPESDLRGLLFVRSLVLYQQAGDSDKVIEMGRKALSYMPDNPATLAILSSELAERTRETDLDRDERLAEATKYANHALETVDKLEPPAGMTPEQVTAAKNQLRSAAYGALGMAAYVKKDFASAEKLFRQAIDVNPTDPDRAYVMLRLTVALDKQNKYADALDWANKTAAASQPGTPVHDLAVQEQTRLTGLISATKKAPASAAPPSPQPQPVTPK